MSYMSEISGVLLENGYITYEQWHAVKSFLQPLQVDVNGNILPEPLTKEERAYKEREYQENRQELEADLKLQAQDAAQQRRRGGGGQSRTAGRRAIKAPELDGMMPERAMRRDYVYAVLPLVAVGWRNDFFPILRQEGGRLSWQLFADSVEQLFVLSDDALRQKLAALLSQAVTRNYYIEITSQMLGLYVGQFFEAKDLADVCGPSIDTFLTEMRDDFETEFKAGQKNSWLYADAPNLVIMRKALIVRNRLRGILVNLQEDIDDLVLASLGQRQNELNHVLAVLGMLMKMNLNLVRLRTEIDITLEPLLENLEPDREKLTACFGKISEPLEQFFRKLVHQNIEVMHAPMK